VSPLQFSSVQFRRLVDAFRLWLGPHSMFVTICLQYSIDLRRFPFSSPYLLLHTVHRLVVTQFLFTTVRWLFCLTESTIRTYFWILVFKLPIKMRNGQHTRGAPIMLWPIIGRLPIV